MRPGDVLSTTATYDTRRASWWESMGIMVVYMAETGPGVDPFKRRVNFPGTATHGHLPENDNHGGESTGLPDPRSLPDGTLTRATSTWSTSTTSSATCRWRARRGGRP